jgi:hypothetical protein
MERVAIVARLRQGSGSDAVQLIEAGPASTSLQERSCSSGGGRSSTGRRGSLANSSLGSTGRRTIPSDMTGVIAR